MDDGTEANCALDNICTMIGTPEMIIAIVDRFRDGHSRQQHPPVQALLNLAKFGGSVHLMMTCTS